MEKLKRFFKVLGPGFVTGAADDDPSGIGTYAQTGVQFGYNQLWLAFFSFPFMLVIQEMCGRIGMVTGKGLSCLIKNNYSAIVLYISVGLLLIANTVNIGADLAAMAASSQLVFHFPFIAWLVLMTGLCIGLQVVIPYSQYSKYLKYLTLSLFAYIVTGFVVQQNWGQILHATLVPSLQWNQAYLMNIVAILGTTISPYLFFWQTSEQIEKSVEEGKQEHMCQGTPEFEPQDLQDLRLDTGVGMFFSNLIMFFIIVTMASTLGAHGIKHIESADQAAKALQPIAGPFASLLFTVGIVGTGLLAVPVLAGSVSYAVSEVFGWKEGLYRPFNKAMGFYGVIIVSTLLGFFINFMGIPPFKMLYYTAILNGLCAPPLMVLIILITNNSQIMGQYTNKPLSNVIGWLITIIMTVSAVALIWQLLQPHSG